MHSTHEKVAEKRIIGLELRTENREALKTIPPHWDRFFKENVMAKIPNKLSNDLYVVYTNYEEDYKKPYTYILGCEVSTLDEVPAGLVAVVIPASTYTTFTTEGQLPKALGELWHRIWSLEDKHSLNRAYTTDFEFYPADLQSQTKPAVKVYIAMKK